MSKYFVIIEACKNLPFRESLIFVSFIFLCSFSNEIQRFGCSSARASVAPPLSNLGAAGCVCAIDTDRELPVSQPQIGPFPESKQPENGTIQTSRSIRRECR